MRVSSTGQTVVVRLKDMGRGSPLLLAPHHSCTHTSGLRPGAASPRNADGHFERLESYPSGALLRTARYNRAMSTPVVSCPRGRRGRSSFRSVVFSDVSRRFAARQCGSTNFVVPEREE